jgi:predicted alpha/beta superfamily hydrolase
MIRDGVEISFLPLLIKNHYTMQQVRLITLILWVGVFVQLQGQASKKTFVLGEIDTLFSKVLNEKRVLNIYVPEGYSPDSAAQYPVIYLLDGTANEDFIHVVGLVQFYTFPWINVVPKSIVVGIANVDRKRDFTYPTTIAQDKLDFPTTGGSEKFIAFLENELQPYIQSQYKTNGSKTLIGQSLGGLLATEILFKKPDLFSKYIIVSPSLWWDNESLLQYAPKDFQQPKSVFIAVGKEGKVMVGSAKKLNKALKNVNSGKVKVHFKYIGDKDHTDIYHQALSDAFESLK